MPVRDALKSVTELDIAISREEREHDKRADNTQAPKAPNFRLQPSAARVARCGG
jgi:hypothetical protein